MQPGDTFMGLDLAHGGHLSHGSPVNMSGKYFKAVGYQLDEATGVIDYDAMERKALECKPKLIVGGASAYSREWDYKRMRAIADKGGCAADGGHGPHGRPDRRGDCWTTP